MATKKRSCWLWLEDRLYSFCAECTIIILTLINVLAIAAELLIGLRIITAPYSTANRWHNEETDTASLVNVTTEPQDRSTQTLDPGEYPVDPSVRTAEIVCHYISIVIAALFMAEIFVKLLVKNKEFFKDRWQIFDAVVVMVTLALEILLSLIKTTSEYPEAATFVVILRLWRLHKVCNMKTHEWSRENDIEIYQYEETKKKEDDMSRYLQLKVDKQEKEIKRLESMLRRYQHDNNIDSNRNNTETLLEILESKEPYDRYAEVKSNSIIESATQEAAHLQSSFQNKMANGHVPNERSARPDLQEVCTNSESETDHITLPYSNGDQRLFRADSESSMSQDGGLTHNVMVDVEGGTQLQDTEILDVERGTALHATETVDIERGTVLQDVELHVEEEKGTVSNKDDPVVDGDAEEGQYVYTNQSFETDVSLDDRNWPVLSEIDGTKTYRSAEGIPMTSL